MKTKDIPERPILEFLERLDGKWATWGKSHGMPTVSDAIPPEADGKLHLSKMRNLIGRGLVEGCICGCRGDFVITEKGRTRLAELRSDARAQPLKEGT